MDSPNSTTNRNSGSHETTPWLDLKSSSFSAQVCWNTSTSRPYAAPTDSMFSTIAVAATTTERNVHAITRNVSSSTNPTTRGRLCLTCSE